MSKLPSWNSKDIIRILRANGWYQVGSTGKNQFKYTDGTNIFVYTENHFSTADLRSIFKRLGIIPDVKLAKKIQRKTKVTTK